MPNAVARPLEGIRVLDLTAALAGPYGALLLGGMGAEVIHVESPGGGDIARTDPPFVGSSGIHFGDRQEEDISLTMLNRGRNKRKRHAGSPAAAGPCAVHAAGEGSRRRHREHSRRPA
ncbi:CoA transferase [Pseudorhodoferax sp.]|uniref:CoA transferase n=1 Tax=Pseudorhodoferax sp. TaxID=1993553 RepID=UPI0039E6B445